MTFDKMSATEIETLSYLYKNSRDSPNQKTIARNLKISVYKVSRAFKSLNNKGLVKSKKIGISNNWILNKNKKTEISDLVTLYENCKKEIENRNKSILRLHNVNYLFEAEISKNYARHDYTRIFPSNRFCLIKEFKSFKLVIHPGRDLQKNSIQIFLKPLFLLVPLGISEKDLEELCHMELSNRLIKSIEEIEEDKIIVKDEIRRNLGEIAIEDDYLARLALTQGLNNKFLDNSLKNNFGETEYGYSEAIKIIPKTLSIRKFLQKENLNESQFCNVLDSYYSNPTIGSPIPNYPIYAIGSSMLDDYLTNGGSFI